MALGFAALRGRRAAACLALALAGLLVLGLALGLTPAKGADPWADDCDAARMNPYASWEMGAPATHLRARLCDGRPSWLRNRFLQSLAP